MPLDREATLKEIRARIEAAERLERGEIDLSDPSAVIQAAEGFALRGLAEGAAPYVPAFLNAKAVFQEIQKNFSGK